MHRQPWLMWTNVAGIVSPGRGVTAVRSRYLQLYDKVDFNEYRPRATLRTYPLIWWSS